MNKFWSNDLYGRNKKRAGDGRPDPDIRGCYVNEKKEIIAQFDQSMALLGQTETEQIIALLR